MTDMQGVLGGGSPCHFFKPLAQFMVDRVQLPGIGQRRFGSQLIAAADVEVVAAGLGAKGRLYDRAARGAEDRFLAAAGVGLQIAAVMCKELARAVAGGPASNGPFT
ncbi:MAG TPA: hypothetical protein VHY20_05600 [Pirellulales bacterium]|nr:hypothetical protein [Pirellulales bacterium]